MTMNSLGAGLEVLNSKGCGVCKAREFRDVDCISIWEKIKKLFGWKPPKRLMILWCSTNKKWVKTTDICMKYDPVKQVKFFGASKDEEVKFDRSMLEKRI